MNGIKANLELLLSKEEDASIHSLEQNGHVRNIANQRNPKYHIILIR